MAVEYAALKGCTNLLSVTLPSTLERIGAAAFEGCSALGTIELPDSLREVGVGGFSGCSSLRSIEIPDSLREIGAGAFSSCSALGAIRIPGSVGTIRPETFSACRMLSWVTFPDGLRTIEGRAFDKCTSLRRIALPSSIEELAPRAFEDCDDLSEATIAGEGYCGTFYRSAFLGCPVASEPTPIGNLPSTATLVNDAVFPAMFEGPSHKLRALRFETTVHDGRPSYLLGFLIVDRGVAGLNSFTSSSIGGESAAFWVQLDDGCDWGFYAVRGTYTTSGPSKVFEGYLEPEEEGYSFRDPSQREFDSLTGDFSVYLHNCHLMATPSIDGEQAARLVDNYRAEVVPLAVTYRGVERDTSGQGKAFEEDKLATLDGLHARIWAADARFRNEARQVGLDSEYYIQTYSASLGSGLAPSAKVAQAREAEARAKVREAETRAKELAAYAKKARRLERSEARANAFGPLLLSFLGGCFWLVVIGISAVVVFLLLLMLLFI